MKSLAPRKDVDGSQVKSKKLTLFLLNKWRFWSTPLCAGSNKLTEARSYGCNPPGRSDLVEVMCLLLNKSLLVPKNICVNIHLPHTIFWAAHVLIAIAEHTVVCSLLEVTDFCCWHLRKWGIWFQEIKSSRIWPYIQWEVMHWAADIFLI